MALDIHDLTVHLAGRQVLDRVSLRVAAGEVVGILGPNGAGKSTLIKAALGLVPITEGSINHFGAALATLTASARSKTAAYVPQEREAAWALSVEALVALGRLPHLSAFAAPGAADRAAIDAALMETGLTALRLRPVTDLSGGERARALIARALAQTTPLLLADEPASGLDPAYQLALLALFRRKAAAGQAIALSIHELHLAACWCDRLVLLHQGRIAAEGAPRDVLTRHNMQAVYGCDSHITETPHGLVVIPLPARPEEADPEDHLDARPEEDQPDAQPDAQS